MIKLYHDDCVNRMCELIYNKVKVDLIVTSPPYDDLREYNSVIDWEDFGVKAFDVLNEGGVMIWNVNDKIENGSKSLTSFKQCLLFNKIGFNVNDVMIWKKTNPMPQVSQPRYNQVFEYMFVFSKGTPKTFNPLRVSCKCAGRLYDSTCKKITLGKERTHKKFEINSSKIDNNIWEFSVAQNQTEHPAVFPLQLPLRHIQSWSNENDTVLDPFMGSGTTGVACKKLNRNFIGIELNEKYFEIAKERIEKTHVKRGII